jgi:DNA-binding NarL/FixJ family response regulator
MQAAGDVEDQIVEPATPRFFQSSASDGFGRRALRREPEIEPGALGLTARQTDVLKLLVQGKPNKLICRDLTLSEGTVKVHVSAILKALHVHSRTEAIAVLARRGISVDTLAARRQNAGPNAR